MTISTNENEVSRLTNVPEWFQNKDEDYDYDYDAPTRRPLTITVVCAVIAIALVYSVLQLLNLNNHNGSKPALFWVISLGQMGLVAASLFGLWKMKKWGVYLYTLNCFLASTSSTWAPTARGTGR